MHANLSYSLVFFFLYMWMLHENKEYLVATICEIFKSGLSVEVTF